MKIKSFEYCKYIRNYEKLLGTSDIWLMSNLSSRTSKPAYYIVDCQILSETKVLPVLPMVVSLMRPAAKAVAATVWAKNQQPSISQQAENSKIQK